MELQTGATAGSRDRALRRLRRTTWSAAVAATGAAVVFGLTAASTIPGKTASEAVASTSTASSSTSQTTDTSSVTGTTPTATSPTPTTVSPANSGPTVAVSGGSK